jgi:microcystin-dependent protein
LHSVPHAGWAVQLFSFPSAQPNALQAGYTTGNANENQVTQTVADQNTSNSTSATDPNTVALSTDSGGAVATDPADPPYVTVNYLIKTTKVTPGS